VDENNAADDVVYDMNHFDPNTVDTIKYICSFPDGGNAYFYCDEKSMLKGASKMKICFKSGFCLFLKLLNHHH